MMRNLRRLYQHQDGGISVVTPAWDDRCSPFGPHMAPVRAQYQSLGEREQLRCDHADWLAMFPFDPFLVSEAEWYEWAVTKHQPPEHVSLGDVAVTDLPPSREFRDCWRWDAVRKQCCVDPMLETAERWKRVRAERNVRLVESDGPMARATETGWQEAAWKAYRQALRDVPTQADPKAIVWPVKPQWTNSAPR